VSRVEAIALSLVSFLAAAIVAAYFEDAIGLTLHPRAILLVAAACAGAVVVVGWRHASTARAEAVAFAAIVVAVGGWLLLLAWPHLLPLGAGPDLTHHLSLIAYIERTRRLVHDPAAGAWLGEMADYTPGSQLLAVLFGAWSGTDGLHTGHIVIALTVALKAGFVFFIASRCLPGDRARLPLAAGAVLLLFLPRAYFLGSFTEYWFLAQVVAELFAVVMWWALVAWDELPSRWPAVVFGAAGAAAFLTWPVWVGPLAVTLAAVFGLRSGESVRTKASHAAIALAPIAIVAAVHAIGRTGATAIAATTGFAIYPTASTISRPFIVFAIGGLGAAVADRRARTIVALAAAIALQTAALYILARANGAAMPYMALKMFYLAIYPGAVAGAIGLRRLLSVGTTRVASTSAVAWALVVVFALVVARHSWAAPRPTPVVSGALYDAGRWARTNVDPACVDYLVADDDTAYWLHLAVLGNARTTPRSLDSDSYEPKPALVRWVLPGGLPYAIVGSLNGLPNDIRTSVDVLARFGDAAVVGRRGASTCKP
jgi:hypothetical protein